MLTADAHRTNSRGLFVIAVALFAAMLLWRSSPAQPAYAQLPDAGAQREAIVRELRTTNAKLGEITELLKQIREQTKPVAEEPKAGVRTTTKP